MNAAMIFSGVCLVVLVFVLRRSKGFSHLAGALWVLAGGGSVAAGLITLDVSPVSLSGSLSGQLSPGFYF